uniref:Thioredoxin domain-containing protein n=1 Tax=Hyaloperonospora arabidopsidis (strain Emoy2) TaxID=559515 RepID=M4BVH3_HYAAE
MGSPRYDQNNGQRRRRVQRGIKRIHLWYLLASAFLLVYLVFLARWGFGNISSLEGFVSTEPLKNLRKISSMKSIPLNDNTVDGDFEDQSEEHQRVEGHVHQVDILQVGHPTTTPSTVAFVAIGTEIAAVTQTPQMQDHVVVDEEIKGSMQSREEMDDQPVEAPKVVAAVKPTILANTEQQVAATAASKVEALAIALPPSAPNYATVSGYAATMKFLKSYRYNPDESLFLFFTCSDEHFQASDWSKECVQGKQHVYDVFSQSPGRNRLVTVFAGSEKYWKRHNDFNDDLDLRVKGVPCIMKWEGRDRRTEGMLVQKSLYDEPFLRYLFKKTDQPEVLFASTDVKNKQIVTVKGYDGYLDAMSRYVQEDDPVPTFLMMVSGRIQNNNRPWCPYCRYSELPLEFAFYSYAPKNARMIRVEVTDSYAEWRKRNKFSRDENVKFRSVPLMFYVEPVPASSANGTGSFKATSHKATFVQMQQYGP